MQVVSEAVRWKYYKLANGEYSIYIRMTNYRKVEYIKTQMSCLEANWDEEKGMPKPEHPQYSALTKKIDQIKEDIDFELKLAKKKGESLTLVELKSRVENEEPKTPAVQSKKIFELYDEIIDQKEKAGKPGASDIFKFNKTVFFELFDEKDKFFTSFTEKDFLKIDPYLDTLKTESTKSLYLRTFYRVWNIAIKRKYCPETLHPKFIVDYKPYKRIKTKKRAIPREYITLIENLQLPYNSRLFRSQQFAIFIYYARGINFKDFAQLKKIINVHSGYIKYKRSKNGRDYDFKLHPKAQKVVEIFENYPMQSDADYAFPILDLNHDTPRKVDTRIDSALKDFNEDLVEFETITGCPKHISSYVLRHAFASHLRNKNVATKIIQEALGHDTEAQTNVYLDEIDDTIVAQSIEEALV